tara:strand:+ start:565 stop:1548 length:984 start_codon:yes stop_codon:yes gene_type:complete
MSFCPIDEAFGNYLTSDLNPHPLESTLYNNVTSADCTKKKKLKKKRINCNKKHSSFTMNPEDLYKLPPDVSDEDSDFNDQLQSYNPYELGLYDIKSTNNKITGKKLKKKKTPKNIEYLNHLISEHNEDKYNSNSKNYNIIESFEDFNDVPPENKINVRKTNKKKKHNKRPEINEIYEHTPEDDLPIDEIGRVHLDDTDSENEETKPIFRNNNNLHRSNNLKSNTKHKEVNSQISEINNKINFIMNQIAHKGEEDEEKEYNNINDIVLFVIFGVFVLILIEALYRLITKIATVNSILSTKMSSNNNSQILSRGPLEMMSEYIKKSNNK